MLGRRVCTCCGTAYNVTAVTENGYNLPALLPKKVKDECDKCPGTKLITRDDDNEQVISERLKIYSDQIKPVREYFHSKDRMWEFEPKRGMDDYPEMLA